MIKFNTYSQNITFFFILFNIYFISLFINANSDLDKLTLPSGFEISIFADNLDSPRQISETDDGYIIVGSKKGDKLSMHYMIKILMDMQKKEFLLLMVYKILLE